MRRSLAVVLAASLALAAGCGAGGPGAATHPEGEVIVETGATTSPYLGGVVENPTLAPELGLRTPDGRRVTVASLRGRVVLVTFLYTRCPDICPLIIDKLRRVQTKVGTDRVRIVVVSVDPRGDTPATVRGFLRAHRMTGRADWLVGTAADLRPVWKRWGILAERSTENPALIEHNGVVWVMDARGRRAVYFPLSAIEVDDIVHDVRLLLKQPAG